MNADVKSADVTLHELSSLADAGELAAALAHEVNDFLNVLHLQLTVLELKSPPDPQGDLIELRRQAKQLAELIRHWQRSRSHPSQFRPIDLGLVLHRLDLEPGPVAVHIDVAPNVRLIQGIVTEVRRLVTFLIKNAISAASPGPGQVSVRVEPADRSVRLRVEDSGPKLPEDLLARVFEPSFAGRPRMDGLELAACRGIVRRMNGTIHAENVATGGFAVVVELPAA
jgi:signal transduction histidine kinase